MSTPGGGEQDPGTTGGGGTDGNGEGEGGDPPPTIRTTEPSTPGGDLGTHIIGRSLETPTAVSSATGGPS